MSVLGGIRVLKHSVPLTECECMAVLTVALGESVPLDEVLQPYPRPDLRGWFIRESFIEAHPEVFHNREVDIPSGETVFRTRRQALNAMIEFIRTEEESWTSQTKR